MNESVSVIDAQVEALLKLIEDYRESRCRQLLEKARSEAAMIVRQTHREGRARMHKAITEERSRTHEKLASTQARLQTQRRQRQQQADMALLQRAWAALREALLSRWQDAEARRTWIQSLFNEASAVLPAKPWQVEHPSGWDPQEAPAGRAHAQSGGGAAKFVEMADIDAGLRIRAQGTCLDGTLTGLLTGRAEVEAQLLAEYYRVANALTAQRSDHPSRRKDA